MFSSVSLINGKMGESHTTVGIPASRSFCSAAKRAEVVQTFGSSFRQSASSYVVSVICTTHFVLSLMACRRSISRSTRSDFVCSVKPKPYRSASESAPRT